MQSTSGMWNTELVRGREEERERRRVSRHIARAERLARTNDISRLPRATRLVRELLLQELGEYRKQGRFPINVGSSRPLPIFIDQYRTRCALAHLMELSGAGELAAEIAAKRNHAGVRELAGDPRVAVWLAAAGFSVAEATLFQPQYCELGWSSFAEVAASNDRAPVPVEVVLVGRGVETAGEAQLEVDAIFGNTSGLRVAVGDVVACAAQQLAGQRALVALRRPEQPLFWGVRGGPNTLAPTVHGRSLIWLGKADAEPDAAVTIREGAQGGENSVPLLLALASAINAMQRSPGRRR